jgi:hypothetical protein
VLLLLPLLLIVAAGAYLAGREDGASSSTSVGPRLVGSGVAATQARTVPPFTAVEAAGGSSLSVRVGARQTVAVHADDNLIHRIETDVRDGVLVVSERGSFATQLPLSVEVTVPTLGSARLLGSGSVSVPGVESQQFSADLVGSGALTISGITDRLDASLAGSGDLDLGHLSARSVTASLPGSGRLDVNVSQTLHASLLGSGDIVYRGDPATVERALGGSGSIVAG